ncbi:MAG: REP-associated tyrosine transposase [Planctomycetota bacterium]|jgi:REP element-mobilizing transposase RayT
MSADEGFSMTRRRLPHLRMPGSVYFVTFRLAGGSLSDSERNTVLQRVMAGRGTFYALLGVVVMPNHVHMVLQPKDGVELSRIMKGLKGSTARLLNRVRGVRGSLWQDECFDRIIRDEEELAEKLNYMLNNPVSAGLVATAGEYEWAWFEGLED